MTQLNDYWKLFYLFVIIVILLNQQYSLNLSFSSNIQVNSDNNYKKLDDLKRFSLNRINQDRMNFGLSPLSLSNNTAAQVHADELLKTEFISHWTVNGYKPYMLYTVYNGVGYVQQNIGQISYVDLKYGNSSGIKSSDFCNNKNNDDIKVFCKPIDPYDAIDHLEQSMVYNDLVCCNNGHKNNILDPYHTDVSIGIAYDKYYLVIVQNFENHYIEPYFSIQKNDRISIDAKILPINNLKLKLDHISLFIDDLPSETQYKNNKFKMHYEMGDLKAIVAKPLPPYKKYVQHKSFKVIEAKTWKINKTTMKLGFNIPSSLKLKNKVMTIVIYAENMEKNNKSNDELIPLTSYTFFDL